MLVIAIIGILAFIGISTFSSVTKSMKLDIAGDMLVSAVKQQQGLAKSGKGESAGGEVSPLCYGMHFEVTDKGAQVSSIKTKYVSIGQNKADYCEEVNDVKLVDYEAATDYKIFSIAINDNEESRPIDILFKPPFAKVEVKADGNVIDGIKKIVITIGPLTTGEERQYLIFEPAAGLIYKTNKPGGQ